MKIARVEEALWPACIRFVFSGEFQHTNKKASEPSSRKRAKQAIT